MLSCAVTSSAATTDSSSRGPDVGPIGFASAGFVLTGGGGGQTVTGTNGAQLNEYASSKTPCTIYVADTLQVSGMNTHVGPNKTIIGVGPNATLRGGGLYLYKSTNGFVSNPNAAGGWPGLKSMPAPTDTDHDGMPDTWETTQGPNRNEAIGLTTKYTKYTKTGDESEFA